MADEFMSDELLVEALRLGSPEGHEQLWEKYGDKLIGFLQSMGADPDDAADAAIESVARAVEKIDLFDPQKAKGKAPFRNWLFTIARRQWHDQIRKQAKTVSLDDEFPDIVSSATGKGPPTVVVDAIKLALSKLSDNKRMTITMHFYDNLPLSEIAKLMEVPEGTIRQWKKRGLAELELALRNLPVFAGLDNDEP